MAQAAKLLTELVGTFILLPVIRLSPADGALAPLYMGSHVSGAHHEPVPTAE